LLSPSAHCCIDSGPAESTRGGATPAKGIKSGWGALRADGSRAGDQCQCCMGGGRDRLLWQGQDHYIHAASQRPGMPRSTACQTGLLRMRPARLAQSKPLCWALEDRPSPSRVGPEARAQRGRGGGTRVPHAAAL
jgi:hypothetical protein